MQHLYTSPFPPAGRCPQRLVEQPLRRAERRQHRFLSPQSRPTLSSNLALFQPAFLRCNPRPTCRHQARSVYQTTAYQMPTTPDSQYEDFFRHTSGRWLWDEQQQLRERFRKFNVPELQRAAAESVGATVCVSMTKLAEGSFNKVFRLVMNNRKVAIARIPNPNAGPECYTTASEVATMDFVWMCREITDHEISTDTSLRLGRHSRSLFQMFMLGVQASIIQLALNISSWRKLQGGRWQIPGIHSNSKTKLLS